MALVTLSWKRKWVSSTFLSGLLPPLEFKTCFQPCSLAWFMRLICYRSQVLGETWSALILTNVFPNLQHSNHQIYKRRDYKDILEKQIEHPPFPFHISSFGPLSTGTSERNTDKGMIEPLQRNLRKSSSSVFILSPPCRWKVKTFVDLHKLEHCSILCNSSWWGLAVKLQQCFVDYETSPNLMSAQAFVDNDWIFIFEWAVPFNNAPTCSLCFLSFSISSILFFRAPSCSMGQRHLSQKETSSRTRALRQEVRSSVTGQAGEEGKSG